MLKIITSILTNKLQSYNPLNLYNYKSNQFVSSENSYDFDIFKVVFFSFLFVDLSECVLHTYGCPCWLLAGLRPP